MPKRVLFVCLGNICRSPTAQGVFAGMVAAKGLTDRITADSCGTAHWHVGESPDARAVQSAAMRGYDLSSLRGRQVKVQDFYDFDYILAMDRDNLHNLELVRPEDSKGHLGLFLDFSDGLFSDEVPDPYYGGDDGFGQVLDLIEAASEGLINTLVAD